jgi:hypothetical protein
LEHHKLLAQWHSVTSHKTSNLHQHQCENLKPDVRVLVVIFLFLKCHSKKKCCCQNSLIMDITSDIDQKT